MASGDQSGTWGTTTNTNLGTLLEASIAGYVSITPGSDADYTLTTANGASDEARNMMVNLTTGLWTTARNVIVPAVSKVYVFKNSSTYNATVKTSAGTGVTINSGLTTVVFCDGTNVVEGITRFNGGDITATGTTSLGNTTIAGTTTISGTTTQFTGTAARIRGDFSNATVANKTLFQDKTTNNATSVGAIPNGTNTTSNFSVFNNSDPTNAGYAGVQITSTLAQIYSTRTGSGTTLPVVFSCGDGGEERGRILTGGAWTFGGTTAGNYVAGVLNAVGYAARNGISGGCSGNVMNTYWLSPYAYQYVDDTNIGAISIISDYRIKQNVITQTVNATDRINALRPVQYEFKDAGDLFKADGVTREGFIAHELQAVIPSAVFGEKDALTEEGKIQPQSLRMDALVSVLVKAVQELSARVAALEGK
jgi:hypothetical protein